MSFPAAFNPDRSPSPPRLLPAKKLKSLALDGPASPLHAGFERSAWQRPAASARLEPRRGRKVLIIGAGPLGRELAATLEREHTADRIVVGFLDQSETVAGDVLGRVENLAHVARAEFVDEIFLAIPNQHDLALRVIREARRNRLSIRAVPDLYGYGWDSEHGPERGRVGLEYFGDLPVLTLQEETVPALSLFWKRTLDLLVAGLALVVSAPLMAAIALLIKTTSPGKILYQSPRVGLKGRRFNCYKFRTMVANADNLKDNLRASNEREGPFFKMTDDPRITGVGQFLRRYSLDELPQVWNVLRGEMSLVGPRPHPLDDFEHYRLEHLRRLDVTPGITGLWQVTARGNPSFQRNMALDLEYIEHWSLGLDMRILWKTVFAVLNGGGV
jgi:exopolysaccharide biosynthesis polyprenyl glycosylphosphotransferase